MNAILLLLVIVLASALMFTMMNRAGRSHRAERPKLVPVPLEAKLTPDQEASVADIWKLTGKRQIGPAVLLDGELLKPAEDVFKLLASRFAGSEFQPTLQTNEFGRPTIMLIPRKLFAGKPYKNRPWLHLLLLIATIATTTYAGALHQGIDLSKEPSRIFAGLPYALALMLILGVHEMGHYLAARVHKMNVSLPYFIPAPLGVGTFGAFIQLREASPSRKALFDVGVAGPLAGLVVTVIALYFGLQYSELVSPAQQVEPAAHHGAEIGSSVLFAILAKVALGAEIGAGHQIVLHPLAFAGWLGLVVTALNLLPIGQLDGGHLADAMFGPRMGAAISSAGIMLLFALVFFVWSGLLMWAVIIYFMAGRKGIPPLNDLSELDWGRMAVGWFAFVLLLAILVPVPHVLYQDLGLHCPYL